jgi:hypothetical protein
MVSKFNSFMGDRLTKCVLAFATVVSLPLSSLHAQDLPKSEDDSFDIEPPLLTQPREPELGPDESEDDAPEAEPDAGKLAQQLERAKKSAASAARLVKSGVLSKVEAEQRALRVVRLESELAHAQMIAAQEQVIVQKARFAAGQASQPEVDTATAALAQASAAAQSAEENYHKAQLEAAALNLRRQRQLLALGSARKSDVARAEKKLAQLQQGSQAPR